PRGRGGAGRMDGRRPARLLPRGVERMGSAGRLRQETAEAEAPQLETVHDRVRRVRRFHSPEGGRDGRVYPEPRRGTSPCPLASELMRLVPHAARTTAIARKESAARVSVAEPAGRAKRPPKLDSWQRSAERTVVAGCGPEA